MILIYTAAGSSAGCCVRPTYYTCVHEMRESDYRPVVAGFEMVISPQNSSRRVASMVTCGLLYPGGTPGIVVAVIVNI